MLAGLEEVLYEPDRWLLFQTNTSIKWIYVSPSGQRVPVYWKCMAVIAIVRYDITAVDIKIMVSCDVMSCILAYIYRRFGTTCCLHFQDRWVKTRHCVIYGSDGWWNGEKGKHDERSPWKSSYKLALRGTDYRNEVMAWGYPCLQGTGILVHIETRNFKLKNSFKEQSVLIRIKGQDWWWCMLSIYYVHVVAFR
jgi:hypothetical protein